MGRANLKLVLSAQTAPRPARRPWGPALVAAGLVAAAVLATLADADDMRRPRDPRETAQQALAAALAKGNEDAEVRATLMEMRRSLALRPLNSRARVAYASLILGLSRRVADARAASFHAGTAARLSPVTVPVVRPAVRVLARTGDTEVALGWVRRMFSYSPPAAAELLMNIDPLLFASQVAEGLPDHPDAWVAWSYQLRTAGRADEARAWIERGQARWPDHLLLLRLAASEAVLRNDTETLAHLFDGERPLPDVAGAAPALTYRARWRAARDEMAEARADLERAERLDGRNPDLQVLAGEAWAALGEVERARLLWNRALFSLPAEKVAERKGTLVRLARLEDRHGRAATSLRLWRSVLDLDPHQPEALERVRSLAGRAPRTPTGGEETPGSD